MRQRIAIVAVLAILATGAYFAWRYFTTGSASTARLTGSGTIEAVQVAVSPLASGRIVSVTATEGVAVKKGDVIFRIDPSVARLQLVQAKAGLKAAKAARDQARRDDKSRADIAAAQAQMDQAAAQVKLAYLQLSYATVRAPVGGTVLDIASDEGEIAAPGHTLATLARLDRLTVSVYIAESDIGAAHLGRKATLTIDSSTASFPCTVTFVSSQAEFTPSQVETRDQRVKLVYRVELSVSDPSGTLKPGIPADVVFE